MLLASQAKFPAYLFIGLLTYSLTRFLLADLLVGTTSHCQASLLALPGRHSTTGPQADVCSGMYAWSGHERLKTSASSSPRTHPWVSIEQSRNSCHQKCVEVDHMSARRYPACQAAQVMLLDNLLPEPVVSSAVSSTVPHPIHPPPSQTRPHRHTPLSWRVVNSSDTSLAPPPSRCS